MRARLFLLATVAVAAILAAAGPGGAQDRPVDLELVLAIDASSSVDDTEFGLQVIGIARAFRDPSVIAAIEGVGGVAVAVMQWAGPSQQTLALRWTHIFDAASATALADRTVAMRRLVFGTTSIDKALWSSMNVFASSGFRGRRRVIDVSGDGRTNFGPDPDTMRDRAVARGMIVNGLTILNEEPDLDVYYRRFVVGGPGAFLMTADSYEDFAAAMRLKLIREIKGPPLAGHTVRYAQRP